MTDIIRERVAELRAQAGGEVQTAEHWLSCLRDSLCTCGRSPLDPTAHELYCLYRRKAQAGESWLKVERP